jgi:flagellar basal body-associated protein FliL
MDKNSVERFEGYQPRVSDRLIDFVGHQDPDALQSVRGMHNFRRDILYEVNKASPIRVSDIIFREFIVR